MTMLTLTKQRAALHYFFAAVIFSIYGGRVCPFIESISIWQTSAYSFVVFIIMFAVRNKVIQDRAGFTNVLRELSIFILGAVALASWYIAYYDFPIESSLKVLFGIGCLGALISLDLALQAQVKHYPHTEYQQLPEQMTHMRHSIASQLATLVVFIVIMLTTVLTMIMVKDVRWLTENIGKIEEQAALISIVKEFVFVAVILIIYTCTIMYHWLQLLRLLLDNQQRVLIAAANGDLTARVPVSHQGELGIIAYYTNEMLNKLAESKDEVIQTRDVAIVGLSALAEARDNETGGHILRTQEYVRALAIQLQNHVKYRDYLTNETVELLYKSAPLHDIGKVGIPDAILLKPGKLTDDEFTIMKTHAMIGADSLAVAEKQMGTNSFLAIAREIALSHHEKWDGSGYPYQLSGDDIPLSGRLMALADVYDALISKRVYKPAFSHDKAKEIILAGNGSHFDPAVVEAFINCEQMFVSIALTYNDEKEQVA
ncbi:MAG: HD domain-containing protein [Moritella sp.]|uniref:HD-GYP domain-containing protein n=1 Tax=Moritella sp. TaxID=78556 RepID=UPI00216C1555|nr:HD domain-containing phosphohydrolase [Moritella sp.]MBL1417399.1 HD domain-containing protein [Moritella sp.]